MKIIRKTYLKRSIKKSEAFQSERFSNYLFKQTQVTIANLNIFLFKGVHVEWVLSDGMDCVLMAQLVRLFAFGHPLVKPNDIVMTVDINLFLMTGDILDPIYENPDKLAWLYQYDVTDMDYSSFNTSQNTSYFQK